MVIDPVTARVKQFAASLKTHAQIEVAGDTIVGSTFVGEPFKKTAVVAFDNHRLIRKCRRDSPEYDPELCDFTLLTAELIITGETWKTRKVLETALGTIAALEGWQVRKWKKIMSCNCMNRPN